LVFISISLLISNHSTEHYSGVSSGSGKRCLGDSAGGLRRADWGKNLFRLD